VSIISRAPPEPVRVGRMMGTRNWKRTLSDRTTYTPTADRNLTRVAKIEIWNLYALPVHPIDSPYSNLTKFPVMKTRQTRKVSKKTPGSEPYRRVPMPVLP